ncbi:hypothetical protein SAMN05192574_11235 [Mucilaginibacter gossypiicola]|uniref:Uncharacterized protein n=1 Tax=Mucilaginibacter gossypiicola TaxID=551995 RepID=A0A1H8S8S8_9SPHI|nr:hypothetical protein SAMN05192574_11235 [Mucilaginibacter gossypiicola]
MKNARAICPGVFVLNPFLVNVFIKLCHCEARSNLVAMHIGHALATRLPRYARNDIVFIVFTSHFYLLNTYGRSRAAA